MKTSEWAMWTILLGVVGTVGHDISDFGDPQPLTVVTGLLVPLVIGFVWRGADGNVGWLPLVWALLNVAAALGTLVLSNDPDYSQTHLLAHGGWAAAYLPMAYFGWRSVKAGKPADKYA